jgi:broad specificity phosphatase PhoE
MPTIWLLRHGKAGDLLGDYDRLSDKGFEQARIAGKAFRHLAPIHQLISGSMRRQQETAGAFSETFGPVPAHQIDARWNEFDHVSVIQAAIVAGITPPENPSKDGFSSFFGDAMGRWASGQHDHDYTETYHAFQSRVEAALTELADSLHSGETAVVATSGGVISAACRRLLGIAPAAAFQLNTVLVNGGMTRIVVGRGRMSLVSLNQDLHLATAGGMLTLT